MKNRKFTGVVTIILSALLVLCSLAGCHKNEYEKAGEDFSSWVNKDPSSWTDTQKDYFNDLMEFSNGN